MPKDALIKYLESFAKNHALDFAEQSNSSRRPEAQVIMFRKSHVRSVDQSSCTAGYSPQKGTHASKPETVTQLNSPAKDT